MKTITQVQFAPVMPKRKRAAAYTRVSYGKEAMLHSLSAQISYYSGHIQKRADWEFAGIYADTLTGTKDSRKEFQRLLDDCRAGKIDQIITKSITRFARNTVTLLKVIRELKLLGIDVFFEEQNIHTMSAEGEMVLAILAAHAQENSLRTSESCKWRVRKQFQEGRVTGMAMLGYHLINGVLTIIPEEAALVQQIFQDYLAGAGPVAITKKLRGQGVKFSPSGIADILRNEKYRGDMLLQKSFRVDHLTKRKVRNVGQLPQFYVRESHEAIIDRMTFDAVQAEIARRASAYTPNAPAEPSYPFTGLVRCGVCGAAYKRKHANAGSKYEKIVWICGTFNQIGKNECGSQQIPEDILLAKTEEAGGFDGLKQITIAGPGALSFLYIVNECERKFTQQFTSVNEHERSSCAVHAGRQVDLAWQNPSRSQSWTSEMKEAARQKSLAAAKKRKEATP